VRSRRRLEAGSMLIPSSSGVETSDLGVQSTPGDPR
jgi:hypothetical protein